MEQRLCACGCGQYTKPYAITHRDRGQIAGEPAKYLKGHATCGVNTGERLKERLWSQIHRGEPDECWPWTGLLLKGSGYGRLKVNGKGVGAHRVAWELEHGPTALDILHKCDNPPCCNPAHLIPGKHRDNMKDMAKKLRRGHKLNHDAVRAIRAMAKAGIKQKDIAVTFKVDRSHVSDIVLNKKRTAS